MTDEDRKLCRRVGEAELQSWLDQKVFEVAHKNVVDKDAVMRVRWVLTWKSTGEAKARLFVLGYQDPDLTEFARDSPTLSEQAEALILVRGVKHVEAGVMRHQDGILVRSQGAP